MQRLTEEEKNTLLSTSPVDDVTRAIVSSILPVSEGKDFYEGAAASIYACCKILDDAHIEIPTEISLLLKVCVGKTTGEL